MNVTHITETAIAELRQFLADPSPSPAIESDPATEIRRPIPLVRPPATNAPHDPVRLPRVQPEPGRRAS